MTIKNLIHPILFAVFLPLFVFINNVDIIPVVDIILPLSIILAVVIILLVILRFVLNLNKSALIVSLGAIIFFSYGHFYNIINKSFFEFGLAHHRYLLIPFVAAFIIGTIYFVKTQRKLDNANTVATSISVILTIILITNFAFAFQPNQSSFINNDSSDGTKISEQSIRPDIYYIILDAYGDAHTLERVFSYDNTDFISYLESKGFQTSHPSFSNYPNTYLSLSSSLNMEYVPYLLDDEANTFDTKSAINIINNNKVMQTMKKNGYKVINFDSGWGATRKLDVADLNLCGKNSFLDSEFLISVVDTSILKPIYVKFFDSNNRERFECIFSELPKISGNADQPVFVFAHLLLPHPPYIFGENGEALTPKSLTLVSEADAEEKQSYLNQLKFTNKKIKEIVDEIIDNSESSPIIVIQSDHGPPDSIFRSVNQVASDKDKLRNINFYYLPNPQNNTIYDGITPVNSFRFIIKNYLGEDAPQLENRNYYINEFENQYRLIDVTEELVRQ